eukprot:XP_011664960.1 PREDICTED: uncharacterized protein LOC105438624 isoform X1 [Strongylocentrotus purpuratus]
MPKKRVSHNRKKWQQSSAKHNPRKTKDENMTGPSTDPQGTPGDGEKAWSMRDGATAIAAMRLEEKDIQQDSMALLQKSSPLVDQPSGDVEVQESWLENLPELTELTLWKVSEVISPHRLMPLALKLGLPQIKLKILLDERSTMCQQEEKTFKMLYQWYIDQIGDPSKFLFQVLTTDEGLDQEPVFKLFFEKQHTCTSLFGRSFQDLQLWEIAEELHLDKLIPLSLRLGLTYATICSIREDSNSHSVNVCFNVMVQWQKKQTAQIDQVETLARILEACRERRIAYMIRQNHLGVTNEGKTLLISEDQPMEGVTEVQLNVTHSNQLIREEAQGKIKALQDASSSEVSLVPSTGVAADFLEGLKTFSNLCKRHSDLVKCLKRSIGRDGFYKLIGLTVDSIHLHVKVYTIKGLRWLQSDVQSGRIGHQLGKVLVSEKTKQQVLEDIVLDVVLEGSGAWDLLSHAVIDPIPPSTSLSTDFENREALKEDRTSSSDLMAQQGHPVVPEATVRNQVFNQEEGNSGLLACSSPLATPGAVASVAPHVSMRQEKCGPEDAVDEDSATSTEKAYSDEIKVKRIKMECCRRVGVDGGKLQLDTFGIELEIPPGAIESEAPQDISLRVLTDTPNLGNSKEEMSVCFGVQCLAPDDLVLKLPVTYIIPHCAVIPRYSSVEAVLYTGEGEYSTDAEVKERIPLTQSGIPNCNIKRDILSLQMNHFSWAYIRLKIKNFFFRGKRLCCLPFAQKLLPEERTPVVLRAHLYDDMKGSKEMVCQEQDIGFACIHPEVEVLINVAEVDIIMTCFIEGDSIGESQRQNQENDCPDCQV